MNRCSAPVPEIDGKAVFDTWSFAGGSIACSAGICGGVPPTWANASTVTVSGNASLTSNVNYGVQAEFAVLAPPGQHWVSGQVIAQNGLPFMDCGPDAINNTGYFCRLDTGPFSVP
jgi:hypothetical protein